MPTLSGLSQKPKNNLYFLFIPLLLLLQVSALKDRYVSSNSEHQVSVREATTCAQQINVESRYYHTLLDRKRCIERSDEKGLAKSVEPHLCLWVPFCAASLIRLMMRDAAWVTFRSKKNNNLPALPHHATRFIYVPSHLMREAATFSYREGGDTQTHAHKVRQLKCIVNSKHVHTNSFSANVMLNSFSSSSDVFNRRHWQY